MAGQSAGIPEEERYDVLVVGCGLSGVVLAERFAKVQGKRVLIVESREHIAGNCYDYVDPETGILMNKYGVHMFHTEDEGVWDYVRQFDRWVRWEHHVLGHVDDRFVSVPPNISTVNSLCNETIQTELEMKQWLQNNCIKLAEEPRNSAEMALSRVGPVLYEKIFRHYTIKQWDKDPSELDPSVLARIPVRCNHDGRYFTDRFQALPVRGFTHLVQQILDSVSDRVEVRLDTDYFDIRDTIKAEITIYTGPIDRYFASRGAEKLEYRSLDFHIERFKNTPFYQPASQVNYPQDNVEFTRIVEYKHILNQKSPHTVIVKETSNDHGDPFYPVPTERNRSLYLQYQTWALEEQRTNGVYFVGRLANYKYFNMDQAIRNALDYFQHEFVDGSQARFE